MTRCEMRKQESMGLQQVTKQSNRHQDKCIVRYLLQIINQNSEAENTPSEVNKSYKDYTHKKT